MHDRVQVRKTIKRQCKRRVKEQIGRCVGIQFLYAVPYFLLVLILYLTIFGDLFALYANGYGGNALSMAMERNRDSVWLVIFVMLVVTGPLMYGMMRFYIGLFRGEEHVAFPRCSSRLPRCTRSGRVCGWNSACFSGSSSGRSYPRRCFSLWAWACW